MPIVSGCKNALSKLIEALKKKGHSKAHRDKLKNWHAQLTAWRNEQRLRFEPHLRDHQTSVLVEKLYDSLQAARSSPLKWTKPDVGAQYISSINPEPFSPPVDSAPWANGFPAAIGAQVAFPDKLVIDIAETASIPNEYS